MFFCWMPWTLGNQRCMGGVIGQTVHLTDTHYMYVMDLLRMESKYFTALRAIKITLTVQICSTKSH